MMNERIKELAAQAQKVVGYTDGGYTEIKQLDQEKFAELIIEQCTQICDDVFHHGPLIGLDTRMGLDGYYLAAAMQCRMKIEEYFGVE